MLRNKSLIYLEPSFVFNKFFPLIGFFFLFNDQKINLFLSTINLFFVLIPITRRPDIESNKRLIGERIEILNLSLLNFILPIFIPLCLKKISIFPPEDFADSYSLTNKKFLFNHGRLSFNILFHSCFFSIFSLFEPQVICSLIIALSLNEYIVPGLKKILLGNNWYDWLINEKIGFLHYWSRKYGWANFISEKKSNLICSLLNDNNFILNLSCLIFELMGPIFILTNFSKNLWCYGTIVFHALVFLSAGILFWQNIILVYMLTFLDSYNIFLVWFLCILFIDKTKTRPLGWISTRLCEKIEIIGILEDDSEKILTNNIFGTRERTIGIRYGRTLLDGNYRTFHIGETSLEQAKKIEESTIEELKNYQYRFKLNMKWLSYFKKFIEYSKNPENWIWEKIVPEGQIFYTQKDKYRFEKPLKNIKFVLKVWYLDKDYKEHLLEEKVLNDLAKKSHLP
jgi:hypothetical protein